MKIGIDISQTAYEGTGVANYVKNLVQGLLKIDKENEYVLFYSSLRKNLDSSWSKNLEGPRVRINKFRLPPSLLDILWNRLHILPIESLVGEVDVFLTSDWTEPPTKGAKKATILYDLSICRYPEETDEKIVAVQKRKLAWVGKESAKIICISQATKKEAMEILGAKPEKLAVVYPGGGNVNRD